MQFDKSLENGIDLGISPTHLSFSARFHEEKLKSSVYGGRTLES